MTTEDYQKIFHEIKNNITLINSSLQLVEKLHPEVKAYSYWDDAMQETSSLKQMLIELSSARLSEKLTLTPVPFTEFLTDFIESCSNAFETEAFQCVMTLPDFLPSVPIDADRLKRALFNLAKNAYEAMNGRGTLSFGAQTVDSFVRFDVTDTGGGISPEYLPNLFTPLATTKENGSGLGLMIARQIIEAHNGKLEVESRPNDGCTFSVFLPFLS